MIVVKVRELVPSSAVEGHMYTLSNKHQAVLKFVNATFLPTSPTAVILIRVVFSCAIFVHSWCLSVFHSLQTAIHAGFILSKDTNTFAQFEVKHELNLINFSRCAAISLSLSLRRRFDIVNGANHDPYSLISEHYTSLLRR